MNSERKSEARLCKICDLADSYVDAEIAKGEAFSEALCDWALNRAQQNIDGEVTE